MFTLIRLAFLPAKVGVKAGKLSAKAGYRTGRLLGYRRLFLVLVGVAIGLLVAPTSGRQLREKLKSLLASAEPSDPQLSDRVRYELSHSPRTWHLPQPDVDVRDGTVVLTGAVPHASARADLERAASSVPGVTGVENLLRIPGTNGSN